MGISGRCITCGNEYDALNGHYQYKPSHKPKTWPECPSCGERYNRLGQHWSQSDCEHPQLSHYQYDIVTGLMMGDGCIGKSSQNPRLQVNMITKEYLEWLDDIFGILGTGVTLGNTAEELARENIDRGFNPNAKLENYNDSYILQTRTSPYLKEFSDWYSEGDLVWPDNIDLTPTVLKHWYVSDGNYNNTGTANHIRITSSKEFENEDKVSDYFSDVGLPRPNRWFVRRNSGGSINCSIEWNVDESEELWEYMLEDGHGIPPGFEYKWPEEFH